MDKIERLKAVTKLKTDPVWFIENVLGVQMFPKQAEILNSFYKNKYKFLALAAGMRGGKSALGAMFAVVEFSKLITMKNPQETFGIIKGQPIHILIMSASEEQAIDSIFSNVRQFIINSEFFKEYNLSIKRTSVKYDKKNIEVKTIGSWSNTAVGRSCKAVVLDEVAQFEKTMGKRDANRTYELIKKSTITFGMNGFMFAISSPAERDDLIMDLTSRNDPLTLELRVPSWEMNPHLTEQSLRQEYKHDLGSFYRDCAVMPGAGTGQVFPSTLTLEDIPNVLKTESPVANRLHVFAIDPAIMKDAFGIACGYIDTYGNVIVDGCDRFIRKGRDPYISPSLVKDYILNRIRTHNMVYLLHDTWNFPSIIEEVNNRGIVSEQHIVTKDDYELLSSKLEDGTAKVVYDEILRKELLGLITKNEKRVDHPSKGSKDVADCVANVVQFLHNNKLMCAKPIVCGVF